jgi:uncharacterized membrane protein
MRIRIMLSTAAAVVAGLLTTGCGNTSNTGGNTNTTTKSDKFTVSGPTMAPTVKQGDRQTVSVTVNRGADFKDSVKLSADAPKGLKATFDKGTVEGSDPKEAAMTVEAAKDAPLGEHMIKVTATPGTGAATTLEVKVKVEAPK